MAEKFRVIVTDDDIPKILLKRNSDAALMAVHTCGTEEIIVEEKGTIYKVDIPTIEEFIKEILLCPKGSLNTKAEKDE